ncbi:hypothetical protein, partial [Egicoccus sp. AB-alg6-2]|uniref:hypothetical protein n=1 Tax=Egicoccus sp. AB-alg6-2 TaxID=3242692 RepID=UPI00359D59F8
RLLMVVTSLLVLCMIVPATADHRGSHCRRNVCPRVDTENHRVEIGVVSRDLTQTRGDEVSTVTNPCEYAAAEESWDPYVDQIDSSYFESGARWYRVDCTGGGFVYRWYVPGENEGVGPQALLREVIQTAFGSVDAGVGTLRLAPADPAPHITGLPSWLAIEPGDWVSRSATVSAGSISVTATLEPQRVEWTLGDGGTHVCDGPGVIYDTSLPYEAQSTDCSYTYGVASTLEDPDGTYPVSAHIVYGASFVVESPLPELNGEFDLGELAGPPTTEDIAVRQIQAVRTSRS